MTKSVRYWVVSPNVKNNKEEPDWRKAIEETQRVFIGWSSDDDKGQIFSRIKKGDLILIAKRESWKPQVIMCGIASSEAHYEHYKGTPSIAQNIKLNYCINQRELEALNLNFKGTAYYGNNKQIPAIYELHPENNKNDQVLVEILQEKINKIQHMENLSLYSDILTLNKNIVLTGAPGTGKTYLAKEIALKIILKKDREELLSDDEKDKLKKQRCFVQFHPSYDYTDFVEGLRPVKKGEEEEIGFDLKSGIFRSFCSDAQTAFMEDNGKAEDEKRRFVFIIDEINRGELSKIFGELFFSIDPGYRGEIGKVKTQYSNLRSGDDQYFFVPDNVYVIGTMNDIDRSVESFDFAIRRRFTWIEIKASDRVSMWNGEIDQWKDEAKNRMVSLNLAIGDTQGLNSSYHIGPAYFLKLKGLTGDFNKLWTYNIEPLLKEYLRGIPNAIDKLKTLESAYNKQDV